MKEHDKRLSVSHAVVHSRFHKSLNCLNLRLSKQCLTLCGHVLWLYAQRVVSPCVNKRLKLDQN